jgi:hypothetical protein
MPRHFFENMEKKMHPYRIELVLSKFAASSVLTTGIFTSIRQQSTPYGHTM